MHIDRGRFVLGAGALSVGIGEELSLLVLAPAPHRLMRDLGSPSRG